MEGDTSQLNSMANSQLPAGSPPPNETDDSGNSKETNSVAVQSTVTDSTASSSESEDEEETIYSYELYSYSDSELKNLVSDGTITRTQYNTEMARRQSNSIEE